MPFVSPKQRRYLWAQYPEVARRWEHEEKAAKKKVPKTTKTPKVRR